jgi:hypothetical protein
LNSINLSCKDFAFSIRNFSSIVVASHIFDFSIDASNVGLSQENFIIGLGFLSSSFVSTFCLIILFIKELETGFGISLIFFAISSVVCLSIFSSLTDQVVLGFEYFSNFKFILGKEKLNVYKIHTTVAISKTIIKDFTAVA